jgi:hypothetical protein
LSVECIPDIGQLRLDQLQLHYNYMTFLNYYYSPITVAQLQLPLQNQQLQVQLKRLYHCIISYSELIKNY